MGDVPEATRVTVIADAGPLLHLHRRNREHIGGQIVLKEYFGSAFALAVFLSILSGARAGLATGHCSPSFTQRLPDRDKMLKPGMTDKQVWRTLNPGDSEAVIGSGNGPRRAYREVYYFQPYQLRLVFDRSSEPSRLKSVTLLRDK